MRILACFDEQNYDGTTKLFERTNVRGIVLIKGRLAMQRDKEGIYKIPGGGMEQGENSVETLARELREEVGLVLEEDSLKELGEITEIRRDIFDFDTKYICHSLFYACSVTDERLPIMPTESEIQKGYQAVWATPEEIFDTNTRLATDCWIARDTAFIKMLMDGKFCKEMKM